MKLPNKKITNYVEQETGGERLIYNLSTDQAYCLNETSAKVFTACDGATTFNELKKHSGYSDELIFLALDELRRRDLIESDYFSIIPAFSRREVIRRVGLTSMVALPIVSSLIAPTAANAQSGCVNLGCFPPGTSTGIRSTGACANDAVRCCSNMTVTTALPTSAR